MVFLDTNIILELILKHRVRRQQVERLLSAVDEPTAISMLSVHLVMYFGRKEQAAEEFLQAVIAQNEILPLVVEDYEWAVEHASNNDFEDALQLAVALRSNCKSFVTLDRKLAGAYADLPLEIIVPE